MKKIIFMTVLLLLVITLSGCADKKDVSQDAVTQPAEMSVEENDIAKRDNAEEGGILNSIKDALTSNKTLFCTYRSNEDDLNVEVKTYIEGKKYKTEFLSEGKKNNSIFDGKVAYSWEEGGVQGIKIDTDCLAGIGEEVAKPTEESADNMETEDVDKDYEELFDGAQDVSCTETGKVDFTIPSNVTFFDQCEMLKNQQQLINDLGGQIPEGLPQF